MKDFEVALIAVSASKTVRGLHKFLLLEQDGVFSLPTLNVGEDQTSFAAAAELLFEHTGLKARANNSGWIHLAQKELVERTFAVEERHHPFGGDPWYVTVERVRPAVLVPYLAVFPEEVSVLKQAKWITMTDIMSANFIADHKTILQAVLMGI